MNMPRHANCTSFKLGDTRSKESIEKQVETMKNQFKSGLRTPPKNYNYYSPKKFINCEKCGNSYLPDSGKQRWCKECVPDIFYRRIMQRYGLSAVEYKKFFEVNNGMCYICNKNKATVVDHCHTTGRARGVLCNHCNSALSIIENQDSLRRALEYVSISK
jgi:protein-arginine kinase activator protein McsA